MQQNMVSSSYLLEEDGCGMDGGRGRKSSEEHGNIKWRSIKILTW